MPIPRKLKRAFRTKKDFKETAQHCYICKEPNMALLDVHRINYGCDGGKYSFNNTVTLCCKCHRLEQDKQIQILGWLNSTMGRVLHIIDMNGEEKFI